MSVFWPDIARTPRPRALLHLRPRGLAPALTNLKVISRHGHFDLDGAVLKPLSSPSQLARLDTSVTCGQNRCGLLLTDADLERLMKAMPTQTTAFKRPHSRPANNSAKGIIPLARRNSW